MASTSPPQPALQSSRPQRVLACVLCQQRKVKCDRKFPCAHCIRSRTKCVPATLATRRRRRRFPERELLERLRKYEDLLRRNNIKFEPLSDHPSGEARLLNAERAYDSDDEHLGAVGLDWSPPATTIKSNTVYEAKNMWCALNQGFQDPQHDSDSEHDEFSQVLVTKAWDECLENDDYFLFGFQNTTVDLSTLHPEPAQILRLWQTYLENVNPLLKVTHTPTLQGRIIEAVSNVTNISSTLEALMFSIYCMATLSLKPDEVQAIFGYSKEDLLSRYQFGCQQALLNCKFLRCDNRDCLTALYLYLVSVRFKIVPRSLSSILGIAMRIAERMGIPNESDLSKCNVLEAEMRRRLWWSLVLFDSRIGELADYKTTKLAPTWDCRIPLNVNDYDLRLEMKEPPEVLGKSTEALFAVVRGELGDFIRNTMFYLDFTAPVLKPIAKDVQDGSISGASELVALEKLIEDKYLKSCDPENPLHFMTIWTARAFLAKYRLAEYHSKCLNSSMHQTEAQRDTAIYHAFNRLECDTKLMTSPLTQGFIWLVQVEFPFPAYIQILQDLRRRPVIGQAEKAWEIMSDNYEARFITPQHIDNNPFHKIFAKLVFQAWEAREAAFRQQREPLTPPKFVSSLRRLAAQSVQDTNAEHPHDDIGSDADGFLMSTPMDFGSHIYGIEMQSGYAAMDPGVYSRMPGLAALDPDVSVDQLDWSVMNWSSLNGLTGHAEPYPLIPKQGPFDADVEQ